jgi:hypothetical protein
MSLNAATLATELREALLGNPDTGASDNVALTAFCETLATTVVDHITANAVVDPGTFTAGGDAVTGAGSIQ